MSGTRWLTETEMRAWSGFLETSDRLHRHVESQLREVGGITVIQYEILHWSNQGAVCMSDLAGLMLTSRSGLTYQVGQMEKAGLVRRESAADDDRRVMVVITDEGRQLLERAAPGHIEAVREGLIDQLTEVQVAQLADIMDTARNHLRAVVQSPPPRKQKLR